MLYESLETPSGNKKKLTKKESIHLNSEDKNKNFYDQLGSPISAQMKNTLLNLTETYSWQ